MKTILMVGLLLLVGATTAQEEDRSKPTEVEFQWHTLFVLYSMFETDSDSILPISDEGKKALERYLSFNMPRAITAGDDIKRNVCAKRASLNTGAKLADAIEVEVLREKAVQQEIIAGFEATLSAADKEALVKWAKENLGGFVVRQKAADDPIRAGRIPPEVSLANACGGTK